jgi:hypothetical protein
MSIENLRTALRWLSDHTPQNKPEHRTHITNAIVALGETKRTIAEQDERLAAWEGVRKISDSGYEHDDCVCVEICDAIPPKPTEKGE